MSRQRVSLEPGLILHQRPYRETSRLLEVLTREHGRVGLVARGVCGGRGARAALLQPLQPLLLSWTDGGGELGSLTAAEPGGAPLRLAGDRLICAWYLNELVLRTLPRRDANPELYAYYVAALAALADATQPLSPILREFELLLLEALGYGLAPADGLDPAARYDYLEHGPVPAAEGRWSGAQLQAIAGRDWGHPDVLPAARRLLRQRLHLLLGGRPLRTPELFESLRRLQAANPDSGAA